MKGSTILVVLIIVCVTLSIITIGAQMFGFMSFMNTINKGVDAISGLSKVPWSVKTVPAPSPVPVPVPSPTPLQIPVPAPLGTPVTGPSPV